MPLLLQRWQMASLKLQFATVWLVLPQREQGCIELNRLHICCIILMGSFIHLLNRVLLLATSIPCVRSISLLRVGSVSARRCHCIASLQSPQTKWSCGGSSWYASNWQWVAKLWKVVLYFEIDSLGTCCHLRKWNVPLMMALFGSKHFWSTAKISMHIFDFRVLDMSKLLKTAWVNRPIHPRKPPLVCFLELSLWWSRGPCASVHST